MVWGAWTGEWGPGGSGGAEPTQLGPTLDRGLVGPCGAGGSGGAEPIQPGLTLDRANPRFCGPGRTLDVKTRGWRVWACFVGPDVRWTVKTRGLEGL